MILGCICFGVGELLAIGVAALIAFITGTIRRKKQCEHHGSIRQ